MDKPRTTIFALLLRVIERPRAGAGAAFSTLSTRKANLPWMNVLLSGASWLLIFTVLLIVWLAGPTNPFFSPKDIYVTLAIYGGYVLLLEATSLWFKAYYERHWFRITRVLINYGLVTVLICLSPHFGRYFWFF